MRKILVACIMSSASWGCSIDDETGAECQERLLVAFAAAQSVKQPSGSRFSTRPGPGSRFV